MPRNPYTGCHARLKQSEGRGAEIEEPPRPAPQQRLCLKCREAFSSEWAGERVCPRCKQTQAWRDGYEAGTRTMGNSRRGIGRSDQSRARGGDVPGRPIRPGPP